MAFLDKIWTLFLLISLVSTLIIDLPPTSLSPPRAFYLATFRDPLLSSPSPPRWFRLFTAIEAGFQLPAGAYLLFVSRLFLSSDSGANTLKLKSGGRDELLGLVYALVVALTTAACISEVPGWTETHSKAERAVFMGMIYGPWVVIPLGMATDMYCRLLKRLDDKQGEKKVQ